MADIKWPDVAHHYASPELKVRWTRGDGDVAESGFPLCDIPFFRNTDAKPLLRHLEDMTEAGARRCFQIYDGTKDASLSDVMTVLHFDANQSASTLQVWLGEPNVWCYLLSKGFDLFDLIGSGQAIRKGVGNG